MHDDQVGGLAAVFLNARCSKTGKTVVIKRCLPVEELLNCKRISLACLLKGKQSAPYGSDYFRLAANDPAAGAGWW